jgi:hypothetical protein
MGIMGGWQIDQDSLYIGTKGNSGNAGDITIMGQKKYQTDSHGNLIRDEFGDPIPYTEESVFERVINGKIRQDLKMAISNNFGIDKYGKIFVGAAEIGGWIIDMDSIYHGGKGSEGTGAGDITFMSDNTFARQIGSATRNSLSIAVG